MGIETMSATTAEDLSVMSDALHDAWIELPAIGDHGSPRPVLMAGRLGFGLERDIRSVGPFRRVEESLPRLTLTVGSVIGLEVADEADIGGLTVHTMHFDDDEGWVVIEGNVPVTVELWVQSLQVDAELDYGDVDGRERWSWRPNVLRR